jgi:hypothetical protein
MSNTNHHALLIFPLLLLLLGQTGSCHSTNGNMNNSPAEKPRRAQAGSWGGEQIRMEVTAQGAEINYPCAHGSIKGALKLDRNGKFDLTGNHVAEHPGPIRNDEDTKGHPARYTGRIDGENMTLTVTLTDTKETVGTFTLTYGRGGRVRKCL